MRPGFLLSTATASAVKVIRNRRRPQAAKFIKKKNYILPIEKNLSRDFKRHFSCKYLILQYLNIITL